MSNVIIALTGRLHELIVQKDKKLFSIKYIYIISLNFTLNLKSIPPARGRGML